MTRMLKEAFDEASKLPEKEQEELARFLIEELESERGWSQRFGKSADKLGSLADEALRERRQGRTSDLDPDTL